MLKDRAELESKLIQYIRKRITHEYKTSERQQWYVDLLERYNIPMSLSTDIITQRKDLSEVNEFILFAITEVVRHDVVPKYFNSKEIHMYRQEKYETDSFQFPIKLHLIKISDEQYIGKTDAQFLMKLRDAQLINYNAETQRALRIMIKGGTKILRPYVDNKAVNEIDESYSEGIFIPNMITLNINFDDEKADYVYDDKEEILKIRNITAFDIIDGYHRYLGMSRNYDRDNKWNYNMMLQVTAFSVGRAKQLIFQENHKTKMREIDSSAYDQYNAGNLVANRLNMSTDCNMCRQINLNDGLINAGVLSQVINKLYFPQHKKVERKQIITTSKEIQSGINSFTEESDEYLERKWDTYEIIIIMYGIYNKYNAEQIQTALNKLEKDDISTLNRLKDINNKVLNILKEVY